MTQEQVTARFFGMPTIVDRNSGEISLANFTVMDGENRLHRYNGVPVLGGKVENGALQVGPTHQTNVTNNTLTGLYYISVSSLPLPLPLPRLPLLSRGRRG